MADRELVLARSSPDSKLTAMLSPGNPHWEINYPYSGPRYSGMNVPEKFKAITRPAPKGVQFVATEVEFAVMICPKDHAQDVKKIAERLKAEGRDDLL